MCINANTKEELNFQKKQIEKTYPFHFIFSEPIRENKRPDLFGVFYIIIRVYKTRSGN